MSPACRPAASARRASLSSGSTFASARASLWRQMTASRISSRLSAVGIASSFAQAADAGAAPARLRAQTAMTTARSLRGPWFILELRTIVRGREAARNGHSSRSRRRRLPCVAERTRLTDAERWYREKYLKTPEREALFSTMSGEPVNPLYTDADVRDDPGLPGE